MTAKVLDLHLPNACLGRHVVIGLEATGDLGIYDANAFGLEVISRFLHSSTAREALEAYCMVLHRCFYLNLSEIFEN
jgi:hypothetical protein